MSLQEHYKNKLSDFLEGRHVELYWKGRVGLYALLKSFGVGPGDQVVMPAFTCVVVPSAVLYLGATPIFVDIEQSSFSSSFKTISSAVTEKTKVIICQNTFGLSVDVEEIVSFAKSKNIFTLEDCTHGFGGTYNGKANGTYCDAAIYSTQWNKPFSTGIGGFISVKDSEIINVLTDINEDAVRPAVLDQLQLFALYIVKRVVINRYTYWPVLKLYRLLSKKGIVVGSSSPEELEGTNQPDYYFKKSGLVQAMLGTQALKKLGSTLVLRKKNSEIYSNELKQLGKNHVVSQYFKNHSFLVYPLLVQDKEVFSDLAEKNRISLGDWFSSPLHPIADSLDRWGLDIDKYPVARYCSEHIVNLPTNIKNPSRVVRFLKQNSDEIISG